MQKGLEVMETALRVLAAINAKRHPDPVDIDSLRAYAGPQADDMGLDEFACEVIHKALQQRAEAKREEAEQAYGAAYPYIHGLNDAVLHGERQRQSIFESGQQAAQSWANKYEESVKARERQLEEREKRLQQQEQENREHHIALRSLSKWDDRNSFVNTVVSTGKNTMGCLILWFLLVVGVLAAIYFAFPHH